MCVIPMMVKVLLASRQPLLCALIYSALLFVQGYMFDMALGGDVPKILGSMALSTLAAWGYFYLLKETEDAGGIYWGVLIVGAGILLYFF
jgi:hypothetical protein